MNPATNHLIQLTDGLALPEGYIPVPTELSKAAAAVLQGRPDTVVSKHSGGQLSRWAAAQRRARQKMAKQSRRRNRAV